MQIKHYVLYLLTVLIAWGGLGTSWGYSADTPLWTHFTFHFAHGNVFHLAANMFVLYTLIFLRNDKWWMWLVSYIIATLCSFIVTTHFITIGFSGIIFVVYGIIFLKDGIKWKPLAQVSLFMLLSCLFANKMAIGLHFVCLFSGTLIGGFIGAIKEMKRKEKLYGRK